MQLPRSLAFRFAVVTAAALLILGNLLMMPPTPAYSADSTAPVDLSPFSMDPGTEKPGHPKLESGLWNLLTGTGQTGARALTQQETRLAPEESAQVIVTVRPGTEDQVEHEILASGGTVQLRVGNQLQVLLPLKAAPAVANLPPVQFVSRPERFHALGVLSEGVHTVHADQWQAQGLGGEGVKVGVLDLGFARYWEELGTELPADTVARSFRWDGDISDGANGHGTMVAEIVHDIAPQADLYLANFETTLELSVALDWLIAQGVTVVNASFGSYIGGPGDGTGTAAGIVSRARAAGILWVNAAGNAGEDHWSGTFSDPNSDGFHNFSGPDWGNSIYLNDGDYLAVSLRWNDWTARQQDYDLLLFDDYRNLVTWSVTTQAGTQPPIEWFDFTAPYSGWYNIAIGRWKATRNVDFDLFISAGTASSAKARDEAPALEVPAGARSLQRPMWARELEYIVAGRSIAVPADSRDALTVGATYWQDDSLARYSSRGPTVDGRIKPDITAPTGVATGWLSSFHGTSASAPHVAGAAALVKSIHPTWGPNEIQSYLVKFAKDLGKTGKDNDYGSGRLEMAVGSIRGRISGFQAAPLEGASVRAESGGLSWEAVTDPEGLFRVPAVAPGSYKVTTAAPQHKQQSTSGLQVIAGQELTVNLTLASTRGILTGTVTNHLKQGVPGAFVRVTGQETHEAETSGTGAFTIAPIGEGTYTIAVTMEDYKVLTKTGVRITSAQTATLNLQLVPLLGTVSGKITDTQKQPLAGALVAVTGSNGSWQATTDSAGAYSIPRVTEGTYSVTVTRDDYKPQVKSSVRVTGGQTAAVSMQLTWLYGTVVGKITNSRNLPLVDATVTVQNAGGTFTGQTDAAGAFTIARVPEGTYSVTSAATDYRTQTKTNVRVSSGKSASVTLKLVPLFNTIEGKITNVQNQGLEGASVILKVKDGPEIATVAAGPGGSYTFGRVSDGTYEVSVTMENYKPQVKSGIRVSGGQSTTASLKLTSAVGNLTGKVTAGSVAVVDATVTIADSQSNVVATTTTDSGGKYTLTGLIEGTYSVTVTKAGFLAKTVTSVRITGGSSATQNVTITRQ